MPRLVAASVKGPRKFVLPALFVSACIAMFFAQRGQAAVFVTPFWANGSAASDTRGGSSSAKPDCLDSFNSAPSRPIPRDERE